MTKWGPFPRPPSPPSPTQSVRSRPSSLCAATIRASATTEPCQPYSPPVIEPAEKASPSLPGNRRGRRRHDIPCMPAPYSSSGGGGGGGGGGYPLCDYSGGGGQLGNNQRSTHFPSFVARHDSPPRFAVNNCKLLHTIRV